LVHGLPRRRREILDEKPQIMLNIAPIKHKGRPTFRAIPRDSET
jgi:hypothetical protein